MKVLLWETRTSKGFNVDGVGEEIRNRKIDAQTTIENGKVSPTLFQLETIAIALEVKITDLFESEYK